MALVDKAWVHVSLDAVVLEWCRAERDSRLSKDISPVEMPAVDELLRSGDLTDAVANQERFRRLWGSRSGLLQHIPRDTEWHDVRHLRDDDLGELRVIYNNSWDDLASHRNELLRVAALKPEPLTKPPAAWERPILWGHSRAGPFTIFEGNHRLIGYASQNPREGLSIPVLIGLSLKPCWAWHIVDAVV